MGTTESLAQWIVATSYDDIPAAAYEQAEKSILRVNAAFVPDREQVGRPIQLVERLETLADVNDLMDAVTTRN